MLVKSSNVSVLTGGLQKAYVSIIASNPVLHEGQWRRKPEEEMWDGRENRWASQIIHTRQRQKLRKGEGEFEETGACKKEQVFTVHINLGDVSSVLCTWLPFLCDLLLFAALSASALAAQLKQQ